MSAGSRWDKMAMARWGVGPKTEVRLTGLGLISFGEAIIDLIAAVRRLLELLNVSRFPVRRFEFDSGN